jgi:uncharacterized membrane protein YeaQ/YmgE (transglycosylase-associated protein family)
VSEAPRRRLLATDHAFGERVRIYQTPAALEVDRIDVAGIQRRRVFFDEVQFVTLHRQRGIAGLAVTAVVLALVAGLVASRIWMSRTGLLALYLAAAVLGILGSLLLPVWTVTVFGKRTRARLRFPLRSGKARRIYGEICRAAAAAQEVVP